MSVESAFRRLREANPVPTPELLRDETLDRAVLLDAARQRSKEMNRKELTRTSPDGTGRRNWVIGLAAAAVVILIGILVAIVPSDPVADNEPGPSTPVETMESFAAALANNDFAAASEFAAPEAWDEQHRNLLGYWEATGTQFVIESCAVDNEVEIDVLCMTRLKGPHHLSRGQVRRSFTVENQMVQTPLEFDTSDDESLLGYAASQDPAGADEACSVGPGETASVMAATGMAYTPACGDFLANHLDGWALATFEHYELEEPADSVRTEGFIIPVYANGFEGEDEAVVVFYRPVECVPAEFNLASFRHEPTGDDPGALACEPPTVDAVQIWPEEPGPTVQVISAEFIGEGSVPVWFIPMDAYRDALSDGIVTIGDLDSLESRRGVADEFHEFVRNDLSGGSVELRGQLDDGTTFQVLFRGRNNTPEFVYFRVD